MCNHQELLERQKKNKESKNVVSFYSRYLIEKENQQYQALKIVQVEKKIEMRYHCSTPSQCSANQDSAYVCDMIMRKLHSNNVLLNSCGAPA